MKISNALREALESRFPVANFSLYFAFIEFLIPLGTGGHSHHILPQKEFPEWKNVKGNRIRISVEDHLRAHYYLALCAPDTQSFQLAFYLMTNQIATHINPDDLPGYAEVYKRGRTAQLAASRIVGKKAVESGQLAEMVRMHGKKNGEVQGRKNIESGHMTRLKQRNTQNGHLLRISSLGGKISGPLHVENMLSTSSEDRAKGGRKSGRKNVESGHLDRIRPKGHHVRCHVKRGILVSSCKFCKPIAESGN